MVSSLTTVHLSYIKQYTFYWNLISKYESCLLSQDIYILQNKLCERCTLLTRKPGGGGGSPLLVWMKSKWRTDHVKKTNQWRQPSIYYSVVEAILLNTPLCITSLTYTKTNCLKLLTFFRVLTCLGKTQYFL